MWDVRSRTRDQTRVLCIDKLTLNYWTNTQVPFLLIYTRSNLLEQMTWNHSIVSGWQRKLHNFKQHCKFSFLSHHVSKRIAASSPVWVEHISLGLGWPICGGHPRRGLNLRVTVSWGCCHLEPRDTGIRRLLWWAWDPALLSLALFLRWWFSLLSIILVPRNLVGFFVFLSPPTHYLITLQWTLPGLRSSLQKTLVSKCWWTLSRTEPPCVVPWCALTTDPLRYALLSWVSSRPFHLPYPAVFGAQAQTFTGRSFK